MTHRNPDTLSNTITENNTTMDSYHGRSQDIDDGMNVDEHPLPLPAQQNDRTQSSLDVLLALAHQNSIFKMYTQSNQLLPERKRFQFLHSSMGVDVKSRHRVDIETSCELWRGVDVH